MSQRSLPVVLAVIAASGPVAIATARRNGTHRQPRAATDFRNNCQANCPFCRVGVLNYVVDSGYAVD